MKKHIGKVLILIAGMIVSIHTVIPHHHHFNAENIHLENSACNTTTSEHNKSTEVNCHTLNIIGSKKLSITPHFSLDLVGIETKSTITLSINTKFDIINFWFSPPKKIFLTNHSLRGPPNIV